MKMLRKWSYVGLVFGWIACLLVVLGFTKVDRWRVELSNITDLRLWVNLSAYVTEPYLISPQLWGTDIARVFLEADLHLKQMASDIIRETLSEGKDGFCRIWIVPGQVEVELIGGKIKIKKAMLSVQVKGLDENIAGLVEKELTEQVNKSADFAELRELFKLYICQWVKRQRQKTLPQGRNYNHRYKEVFSARPYLDAYLREIADNNQLVGGIVLAFDGGKKPYVAVDFNQWEKIFIENSNPDFWQKRFGLGKEFLEGRKIIVQWFLTGYGNGIIDSEDKFENLCFNAMLLSRKFIGDFANKYNLEPVAVGMLKLLSSQALDLYPDQIRTNFAFLIASSLNIQYPEGIRADQFFSVLKEIGIIKSISPDLLDVFSYIRLDSYYCNNILSFLLNSGRKIDFIDRNTVSEVGLREDKVNWDISFLLFVTTYFSLPRLHQDIFLNFPAIGSVDWDRVSPTKISDIKAIIKDFDIKDCIVQGRTIQFKDKEGNIWRLKFLKDSSVEDKFRYADLVLDAHRLKWLRKAGEKLGLLEELPDLVELRGNYLFELDLTRHPEIAELLSEGVKEAKEKNKPFNIAKEGVFIVYKTKEDFGRYIEEADSEAEFIRATLLNLDALMKLARLGVIMPSIVDLFHNLERPEEGYSWMLDAETFLRGGGLIYRLFGPGRLDRWKVWIREGNLRIPGLWDFENLKLAENEIDWAKAVGNYLFSWFHLYGLFLLKHHREYFEDIEKYAPTVAERLEAIFRFAYLELNPRPQLWDNFVRLVDFKMLARQMLFFMGDQYRSAIEKRRMPEGIYPKNTIVFLPLDPWDQRGWSYINKQELLRICEELKLDFDVVKDLLKRPPDSGDALESYQLPPNIEQLIEEASFLNEKQKEQLKKALLPYKSRWSWSGVLGEEDLGAVNAGYPITELIKALYCFVSFAMIERRDLDLKEHGLKRYIFNLSLQDKSMLFFEYQRRFAEKNWATEEDMGRFYKAIQWLTAELSFSTVPKMSVGNYQEVLLSLISFIINNNLDEKDYHITAVLPELIEFLGNQKKSEGKNRDFKEFCLQLLEDHALKEDEALLWEQGFLLLNDTGIVKIPPRFVDLFFSTYLPLSFWKQLLRWPDIREEYLELIDQGDGRLWLPRLWAVLSHIRNSVLLPHFLSYKLRSITAKSEVEGVLELDSLTALLPNFDLRTLPHKAYKFQGRTLVVYDATDVWRIKIAKEADINELIKEAENLKMLVSFKKELGLTQLLPSLVEKDGCFLFAIDFDSPEAKWLISNIKNSAKQGKAIDIKPYHHNKLVFIAYKSKAPGFSRYLEDLESEDAFWKSIELCVDTIAKLYNNGIYYDALADLFHNEADRRSFDLLIDGRALAGELITRGNREGTGRLHFWINAFSNSNFREEGMADFAEIYSRPGDIIEFATKIAQVPFTIMGIYALWLKKHHPELFKKADRGDFDELAGVFSKGAKRLYKLCYLQFCRGKSRFIDDFLYKVDWDKLGIQMAVFFSHGYRLLLTRQIKASDIFPDYLDVLLPKKDKLWFQRGMSFVHKEEIYSIIGEDDLSKSVLEFFEPATDRGSVLPDVYRFTPETIGKIEKYLKQKQLPADRIKDVIGRFKDFLFRWNFAGWHNSDDLGPVNGPYPVIEQVQASYLFSLYVVKEYLVATAEVEKFLHSEYSRSLENGHKGGVLALMANKNLSVPVEKTVVDWLLGILNSYQSLQDKKEIMISIIEEFVFPEGVENSRVFALVKEACKGDDPIEAVILKAISTAMACNGILIMDGTEIDSLLLGCVKLSLAHYGVEKTIEILRGVFSSEQKVYKMAEAILSMSLGELSLVGGKQQEAGGIYW